MRSMVKNSGLLLAIFLVLSGMLLLPGMATAKSKTVRFVAVGAPEGGQEVSAEGMALNMYLGALDYRMRTYAVLKGKYKFRYLSTLFSDANEALTGVASGAAEMTFSGPHYLEQLDPAWKAAEAPGVFDNWDHFMKTMNTPAWKALHAKMSKEKGITIVKWMANIGNWYLYTSKGPIRTMADLKGQKIRYAGGEAFAKGLKNMGATPISLPYTEVVTGLQTHLIDGLLTDMLAAMYFYNLPRYTKYAVDVVWAIQPICFVVHSKWWDSLPAKERAAMQDVFDRIDTSMFFEGMGGAITQGWAANPKTELLKLSQSEVNTWKRAMNQGSASVLKKLDPKLVQAIESSR